MENTNHTPHSSKDSGIISEEEAKRMQDLKAVDNNEEKVSSRLTQAYELTTVMIPCTRPVEAQAQPNPSMKEQKVGHNVLTLVEDLGMILGARSHSSGRQAFKNIWAAHIGFDAREGTELAGKERHGCGTTWG